MNTHLSTKAVHGGEEKRKPYGALTTPIVQTSTYTFRDTAEIMDFMERKAAQDPDVRDEYGRYSNPTQKAAENKVAALEGAETALLFSSGMSAITTAMLALLSSGDHVVMMRDCYRRTREFGLKTLKRWGIQSTMVLRDEPNAIENAIRPNTKLIFAETPTNPYLRIENLAEMSRLARQSGVLTMLDATFATPINLRPLEHGIDLVAHSATKYLSGHNDILAGAIVGRKELLAPVKDLRGLLGGVSNPQDAYMMIRGLKTLDLRVRRQNENGQRVAEYLESHPGVRQVYYPGLVSHPDHELARQQMDGYGGVVSFEINGDRDKTGRFIDLLQLPYIGPTLGGVEGIAQQQSRFISLDPEERKEAGIDDSLVRYALGIEDVADIVADLEQALSGM